MSRNLDASNLRPASKQNTHYILKPCVSDYLLHISLMKIVRLMDKREGISNSKVVTVIS